MRTTETSCKAVSHVQPEQYFLMTQDKGKDKSTSSSVSCTLRASLADVSCHAFKRSELVRLDTFAEASKSSGPKER